MSFEATRWLTFLLQRPARSRGRLQTSPRHKLRGGGYDALKSDRATERQSHNTRHVNILTARTEGRIRRRHPADPLETQRVLQTKTSPVRVNAHRRPVSQTSSSRLHTRIRRRVRGVVSTEFSPVMDTRPALRNDLASRSAIVAHRPPSGRPRRAMAYRSMSRTSKTSRRASPM